MVLNLVIYLASFVLIWFGAGLIISSIDHFSRKLRFSSFAISFIILGLLTSSPEFSVGLQAVAKNDPNVFIGNLIGGIPVIFLFIAPILAIFGNGIKLKHYFDKRTFVAILAVCLAPSILILDHHVTYGDGIILIILYFILVLLIQRKHGIFDSSHTEVLNVKAYSYIDIIKILIGVGIVFATGKVIFDQTVYFSQLFSVSPFFISLVALSIGTNFPELSLAIRSIASGKKEIAFGDYLGSAAANTFLFGLFTILSGGEVVTENNFFVTFTFITVGLTLFYLFSRSGNKISRLEGIALLLLYLLFIVFELAS
ncbi:MAG: hypothetical protein HYT11_00985 [Candidatus Levybacteria bacterium]|nr:hypothetical protein [Candidatus Levybacteria bacterium]